VATRENDFCDIFSISAENQEEAVASSCLLLATPLNGARGITRLIGNTGGTGRPGNAGATGSRGIPGATVTAVCHLEWSSG